MWCLGPFKMVLKQADFARCKGELLLQEQERVVELGLGSNAVGVCRCSINLCICLFCIHCHADR